MKRKQSRASLAADIFLCPGNILFRDIADFREKNILTPPNNKKWSQKTKQKKTGGFFVPENSKFDF